MKGHLNGDVFCSCNTCPHGNALQCADYKCDCCTGAGGKSYRVTYLKDSGPSVTKF